MKNLNNKIFAFIGLVTLGMTLHAVTVDLNKRDLKQHQLDENLLRACAEGNLEGVKVLIKDGANVKIKNIKGNTCLHIATFKNDKKMVVYLIKKGALINESNNDFMTPLHIATTNNYEEIAQCLAKKGADLKAINKHKLMPIDCALRENNDKIAQFLQAYELKKHFKAIKDKPEKFKELPQIMLKSKL